MGSSLINCIQDKEIQLCTSRFWYNILSAWRRRWQIRDISHYGLFLQETNKDRHSILHASFEVAWMISLKLQMTSHNLLWLLSYTAVFTLLTSWLPLSSSRPDTWTSQQDVHRTVAYEDRRERYIIGRTKRLHKTYIIRVHHQHVNESKSSWSMLMPSKCKRVGGVVQMTSTLWLKHGIDNNCCRYTGVDRRWEIRRDTPMKLCISNIVNKP